MRTLKELEHILNLENSLGVDAHVHVERLILARLEALRPRGTLTHHHLVTTLGALEHEVGPDHQKVRRKLIAGQNETQTHC